MHPDAPTIHEVHHSDENALGVGQELFAGMTEPVESPVRVLEHKHSLDAFV